MLNNPFSVEEVPRGNFLYRIAGRAPRDGAFVELRNMLATTPWHEVSSADVAMALAKYKLLPADAATELTSIFATAAKHTVTDREVNDIERAGLKRLQEAFEFSNDHARATFVDAARELYRQTLVQALADGRVTPDERATLDKIAAGLGLSGAEARRLYADEALKALQLFFDHVIADKRFSPDEEERLKQMSAALGVRISHDEETAKILDRYRLFGRIEAGQLPQVTVPILLQRGESCHFTASNITQKELRTVTKRVNYSGLSTSIRIMKGVRYRVGSVSSQRITQDVLTPIDQGVFFVTSKRVLVQGLRKKTSMPLTKLIHFTVFSDGLQIQKDSGKDIVVTGEADWEVAGACLDAAARGMR